MMPKNTNWCIFILLLSQLSFATDQIEDKLLYNNKSLKLQVHWSIQSPIQQYFNVNKIESPFPMLITALYRGHVATWQIRNDSLLLAAITVDSVFSRDEDNPAPDSVTKSPVDYAIHSLQGPPTQDGRVFADWFTGMVLAYTYRTTPPIELDTLYFFHIREGKIVDRLVLSQSENSKFWKNPKYNRDKYKLMFQEINYVDFNYQERSDEILIKGKKAYFDGSYGKLSPIYQLYGNSQSRWPYYWTNVDTSGPPRCTWILDSNTLYPKSVELLTGSNFEPKIIKLKLKRFSSDTTNPKRVLATWVNGTFLINRPNPKAELDFESKNRFLGFEILRIVNGKVITHRSLSKDFDFNKRPTHMDPQLDSLLNEI